LAAGLGLIFAYAFAFQIYCDFSAYSLIARGSALLFGIDVQRNFLTPYFASNPSDFWQRWHISLSTWLRDYLYVPLGGNHRGTLITLRNLLIVMILGGLWHGAGIMFIFWGLWHGLLLVLYRLLPLDKWLEGMFGIVGRAIAIVLFFQLVCFGWILFRSSFHDFPLIMRSILEVPRTIRHIHDFAPTTLALGWWLLLFTVPVALADLCGYARKCEFPDLWNSMPNAVRAYCWSASFMGSCFSLRDRLTSLFTSNSDERVDESSPQTNCWRAILLLEICSTVDSCGNSCLCDRNSLLRVVSPNHNRSERLPRPIDPGLFEDPR
jgi:alginate O-acetyltransferase complex protein AlgI